MRDIVKTVFIASAVLSLGMSVNVYSTTSSKSKILNAKTISYICHKVRGGQVDSLINYLDDAKIYMDSTALYNQIQCVDSDNDVDNLFLTAVKSKKAQSVKHLLNYIKHREKLTNNSKLLYQVLNSNYVTNDKPLLNWTIEKRKISVNNTNDLKYYTSLEKLFLGFGARECIQFNAKRSNVCRRWKK